MNLVRFDYRRLLKTNLLMIVIFSGLIGLFLVLFPSMEKSGVQTIVASMQDAFPPGFLEAFNIDVLIDFTNLSHYLAYSIQYFGMASLIYALILGVEALLNEQSSKTIEFLYAQPLTRTQLFKNKLISRLLTYLTLQIVFGLIVWLIANAFRPTTLSFNDFAIICWQVMTGMTFSGLICLSLGFLLGTLLKPTSNALALAVSIFFGTYILGVIGKIKANLAWLKYLSPFDYSEPMNLVRHGWNLNYLLVGSILIVLFLSIANAIYQKKDLYL